MVFALLFATAFLEEQRVLWACPFGDDAIHVQKVLSEVADVVVLLAGKDQYIAEESKGESHVECFQGELLNFFSQGRQRVLEVLKE